MAIAVVGHEREVCAELLNRNVPAPDSVRETPGACWCDCGRWAATQVDHVPPCPILIFGEHVATRIVALINSAKCKRRRCVRPPIIRSASCKNADPIMAPRDQKNRLGKLGFKPIAWHCVHGCRSAEKATGNPK